MTETYIAGIDIGGSHITAALIDVEKRMVLEQTKKRAPVNSQEAADLIIQSWVQTIEESFDVLGLVPGKLAVAMPGPFDYAVGTSLMQGQNKFDALYGINIKELLAAALHLSPSAISFANDAACFLQGELFGGVATGTHAAFGLTLGTGFGSARASNGHAEDANLWCAPFKDGIAEDYLSGRWLARRYSELTGSDVADLKELVGDGFRNSHWKTVFEEFGSNLGEFLAPYLKSENVELVVLGGSIAHSFELFNPALQRHLEENDIRARIYKSTLGEDAAMLGAVSFSINEPSHLATYT